jgi:hypothetical protein
MDRYKAAEKIALAFAHKRQKQAEASYPGGPDQWFMNKEVTPMEGSLTGNGNLPTGNRDRINYVRVRDIDHKPDDPDKIPPSDRNAIEMVLVRSDLSSEKIDEAMDLLPNMDLFFDFLVEEGLRNEPYIIKDFLHHY